MSLVHTEAIVLRTYNLAEADRIVVCLTRSAGLVRAVARGARRMKSRFGASLEPFTLINLDFYERENRELVSISQAEIAKSNFDLAAQPEAAEALGYIAELVSEFAPPHEGNEKLYRMVTACVDALAVNAERPELVVRYFEIWILRLAGLFPDLQRCAGCNRIFTEDDVVYLDAELRTRCYSCARGVGAVLSIESRRTFNASLRVPPLDFANVFATAPAKAQEDLAEFTHRLVVRALERRPRTIIGAAAR
jgi:DNA repair protein RecO (recombination protein O)